MNINGYRFHCESPFFVYFKKHFCPDCGNQLMRQKVSKIVYSDSEEAKNYDFEVCDFAVRGNMKFTHIEFFCPVCQRYFTVREIKRGSKKI